MSNDQNDQSQPAIQKHSYKPQDRPRRSDSIGKIAAALAKAQGAMENVDKDGKGTYGSYGTLAATWVAIRKALSENEIAVYQRPLTIDQKPFMCTMLTHSSGEFFDDSELEMKIESNNRMNAMQALGSAVTYARRYTLQAATGVAPEDDDGNAAGDANKTANENKNTPRQQNNSAPTNKTTNPAPKPTLQVKIVSPETMGELGELMAARGVSEKEISYLVKNGFQFNGLPNQTPEKIILEVIKLLNEVDSNSTTIMAHAVKLEKQRAQPPEKTTDAKDPALFIMPLGEDGVKGQPLGKLSEATLKKILEWTGTELKKVPPVKNMPQVFDIQTNVKAFLKSVGVLNE